MKPKAGGAPLSAPRKGTQAPAGLHSLPFLAVSFALISAASWLLADRSLDGVFSSSLFGSPPGIILLVAAPLSLLTLVGILLFIAVSESLHSQGSSALRLRVFSWIAAVLLAFTVSESVILGRFASSALGSWFDRSIPDSMAVAAEMAELYRDERLADIEAVAEKYLNGLAITNWRSRPSDWMSAIRQIDRHAVACQVYLETESGGELTLKAVMESGDSEAFVPKDRLHRIMPGIFFLSEGEPYLRWGETVRYGNGVYRCAYTTAMPEGFDVKLSSVRDAWTRSLVIDALRPFFPWLGLWVFATFLLPPLGMVLILAWKYSSFLASRFRAHALRLESIAGGDWRPRFAPEGGDEIDQAERSAAEIARLLSETGGGSEKKQKRATLKL